MLLLHTEEDRFEQTDYRKDWSMATVYLDALVRDSEVVIVHVNNDHYNAESRLFHALAAI